MLMHLKLVDINRIFSHKWRKLVGLVDSVDHSPSSQIPALLHETLMKGETARGRWGKQR